MNPLNFNGPQFLQLYGALLVGAVIFGFLIPRLLRPEGRNQPVDDADSIAMLIGQTTRFAEGVVARLLASGALLIEDGKHFTRGSGEATGVADRAVLAMPMPATWSSLSKAVTSAAEPVERRLVQSGLMIDSGEARRIVLIASMPYIALLALGAAKAFVGWSRGHPIGYLIGLMVVTLLFALLRYAGMDRRTRGGIAAVKSAEQRYERLKRAPTTSETDMAVALFGTTVLAGSTFAIFHELRTPSSSDSGSSDSGSSDSGGDSGCGGGGCGGCGD